MTPSSTLTLERRAWLLFVGVAALLAAAAFSLDLPRGTPAGLLLTAAISLGIASARRLRMQTHA